MSRPPAAAAPAAPIPAFLPMSRPPAAAAAAAVAAAPALENEVDGAVASLDSGIGRGSEGILVNQIPRRRSSEGRRVPRGSLFTAASQEQMDGFSGNSMPSHILVEHDLDSTASTPPSPVATQPCDNHPIILSTTRTAHQTIQTKQVNRQYSRTSTKTSPVKITKHLQIKRRQGSRASSDVWEHFTPHETEEGPIAICNYCKQVYSCNRAIHGTSTLRKHVMNLCALSPFWDPEKRRKMTHEEHHFSIADCRRALAKMVIVDEMPFNVVEGEGFKGYSNTLEPRFDLPSRITVARDCMKIYLEEKTKLKKSMQGHRICFTTDTWSSNQNLNYMSLTAHWVDDDWILQKRVLNFCLVPDHKGETLGEKIEECLLEWDIGHIFTVTVDNASSNDSAISHLKTITKDWDGVILKNEFLHIRCCCLIVNLIVKSGLEFIDSSVSKIRKAVRYVRSSPGRLDQFKKCVEKEKISDRSLLSLDVETRWNATYLMLESAVKFEKAFSRLAKDNKTYVSHFGEGGVPGVRDWTYAREFIAAMKPFCDVTVRLSGTQYVTSTMFFHDFISIHDKLTKLSQRSDHSWSMMADIMKDKFDKYWGNIAVMNPLLFMAVALDPRYKLKFLDFISKRIYDRVKAKEFISTIEDSLTRLFEFYAQASTNTSFDETHLPQISTEDNLDDISTILVSQFARHLEEIESRETNSELSRFLKGNCKKNSEKFDILSWWKVNSSKYPTLSKLAKDVLAVPVSTVASESVFSTSGRVISPFRSSLSPKMAEALICGQSWIRSSPNNVDLEEIIKDLKNCQALEEEFAEFNCGE